MNDRSNRAGGLLLQVLFSFRGGTALLLSAFLVIYILASQDFGMGWDETRRWHSGDAKLNYYAEVWAFVEGERDTFPSVGSDRYPGLFDMTLALLDKVVPGDRFMLGHAYSAFWGWLAIVGVALIGRVLGGWRLAFFCALFLGLAPVFLGHAGHNPKDIPFATTYIWGVAAVLWLYRSLPSPPLRVWLGCGCAFGLAMAVRISGGVFFVYLIGIILLWLACYWNAEGRKALKVYWRRWLFGACACATAAFLVLFPFWPAIHQSPFQSTVGTLGQMHDLHAVASTKYVHFRGEFYEAGTTPWYYVPWMLVIKVPEIWIGGWIVGTAFLISGAWKSRRQWAGGIAVRGPWFVLLGTIVFPVVYVMVLQPQIHNGIRHILFMLPPLAVTAAAGVDRLLGFLQNRSPRHGALFGLFLIGAVVLLVERNWRLHPYQYLYFNALVGGPAGAFGRYELDYWCLANREALARRDEWAPARPGHRYRIHMTGLPEVNRRFLPEDMLVVPFGEPADFFISTTTMLTHELIPGEPVFIIERAGLPVLVVKDPQGK